MYYKINLFHLETKLLKSLWVIVLLLTISVSHNLQAQQRLTGIILSAKNDLPVEGVNVQIQTTKSIAATDADGRFTINATIGDVLVVSSTGYTTKIVAVDNLNELVIRLEEQIGEIAEVVVIGYGEVDRKDLTGAVGTVNTEDLQKAPVGKVDDALAGRVAGVHVVSPDGQPGANSEIVIRGQGGITQSTAPLYVIDGFPTEDPNLNSINISEVESIVVLKDASSTAIYGSRGANGVILITTKQGNIGKPVIAYDGYAGIHQNIKFAELMDPYEFVKYQVELNPMVMEPKYLVDGKSLEDYRDVSTVIDWQDQVFRTANTQNHDFSVRGGKTGTKYAFSGSVFNQDGLIINSGFKRYQGRINLDFTLTPKLKLVLNSYYISSRTYGTSPSNPGTTSITASVLSSVWGYRPLSMGDFTQEEILEMPMDPGVDGASDYRYNPYLTAKNELNEVLNRQLTASGYAQYNFSKKLFLKVLGGITDNRFQRNAFYGSNTKYGDTENVLGRNRGGPNGFIRNDGRLNMVNENTLTYRNHRKDHNITVLGGMTFQKSTFYENGYTSFLVPNEELGINGLGQGTATQLFSTTRANTLMSFFSRLNYNLFSKYLFTATFRADGSSKFARDNRWGYFPSAAVAWKLKEEDFMKKVEDVSEAKIRMSYGLAGNNRVSDFPYFSTMSFPYTAFYPLENTYHQGGIPGQLGNPDLKWETAATLDVGLDLGFLEDRFALTVDYYNRRTYDLLLFADLPPSSGFARSFKNVGSIKNTGWEFLFNSKNISNFNFEWSTSVNISFNRNKVLALNENQETLLTNMQWEYVYNNTPLYASKVGEPIAQFYGYRWLGNYQYGDFDKMHDGSFVLKDGVPDNGGAVRPGDIKYEDIDGDGTINSNDWVLLGDPNPDFIFGLSNNFTYKDFDLNVFVQGVYGNDVFNANRLIFEGGRLVDLNQFASYENRWTPTNPTNLMYRSGGYGPIAYSSRVVEDGSFIRLKTVALGYTFRKEALMKLKLENLRIYLSGQNLVTLTRYKGLDPEVSVRSSVMTPGFDYTAYPRPRIIVFGLNMSL